MGRPLRNQPDGLHQPNRHLRERGRGRERWLRRCHAVSARPAGRAAADGCYLLAIAEARKTIHATFQEGAKLPQQAPPP
jgi:hypothetical protein